MIFAKFGSVGPEQHKIKLVWPNMDGALDGAWSEAGLARWTTPFCKRSNAGSALLQGEYGDSERESVLDASIDALRGKALLQLLL